jgi:CubicO group peptidase (beta-lactamase class C family)
MSGAPVEGTVAPEFEPVEAAFRALTGALGRGGGAFAVYLEGQLVVDLWAGSARPGQPWAEDTLAVVASATKGLAALCVQILVDRGQLDPDAPVGTYWPEFATNGKEGTLVRHVLMHTAGLLGTPELTEIIRWDGDGEGWRDLPAITRTLAAAPPTWPPGTKHGYHALTFGWLVGELVRRVSGMTLGRFYAREVAEPLGLDTHIGTPVSEHHRVARTLGMDPTGLAPEAVMIMELSNALAADPDTLTGLAFVADGNASPLECAAELCMTPGFLLAEVPASNATTTARALAKPYALLSQGGSLGGVRLLSPEAVARFDHEVIAAPDALFEDLDFPGAEAITGALVSRTLGYFRTTPQPGQLPPFGPSARAYGAMGLGGQTSFADPEHKVAAAFVRSQLDVAPTVSNALVHVFYQCLLGASA